MQQVVTSPTDFGGNVGWGNRPLLLVIDVTRAFTEPDRPLGAEVGLVVAQINQLLAAAREGGHPIMFTRVAYEDASLSDAGLWSRKIGRLDDLVAGGTGVDLDPRLDTDGSEPVLTKKYASCFFGTDLTSRLLAQGIDTLVIAGLSTSGCVRATAVDALQIGFRPIVIEDAVADRWQDAHVQSLRDLGAKYSDLVDTVTASDRLRRAAPK